MLAWGGTWRRRLRTGRPARGTRSKRRLLRTAPQPRPRRGRPAPSGPRAVSRRHGPLGGRRVASLPRRAASRPMPRRERQRRQHLGRGARRRLVLLRDAMCRCHSPFRTTPFASARSCRSSYRASVSAACTAADRAVNAVFRKDELARSVGGPFRGRRADGGPDPRMCLLAVSGGMPWRGARRDGGRRLLAEPRIGHAGQALLLVDPLVVADLAEQVSH
jgi:hypothetical protein